MMTIRIRVYLIATLLTVGTFWFVGHVVAQLVNAIFGHRAPAHYNVTKIL